MQYNAGTVNVVLNNNTVTGVGTAFLANVPVGSWFSKKGSNVSYLVSGVPDDTHLTLVGLYGGPTETVIAYWCGTSRTPSQNFPYAEPNDVDTATLFKQFAIMVDTKMGNAIGAAAQGNRVVFTDGNGNLSSASTLTYDGSALVALGAVANYTTDSVGLQYRDSAAPAKRVYINYNRATNRGVIQATQTGVAPQDLQLNQAGGNVYVTGVGAVFTVTGLNSCAIGATTRSTIQATTGDFNSTLGVTGATTLGAANPGATTLNVNGRASL